MVKHNNVLPNQHYHKQWAHGGKLLGFNVKVHCGFKQATKKKSRRTIRKAKAAMMAPRPAAGLLRPVVHCQTQKYGSKVRAGRGFTLEELKEAGINRKEALGIGIAVDHRRTNLSVESLQANVQRLKAYKAKLVIFPRKRNSKPKNGDSAPEETKAATQFMGAILPITNEKPEVEFAAIPDTNVFKSIRAARQDAKMFGKIAKRREEAARKAEEKAKKKKK